MAVASCTYRNCRFGHVRVVYSCPPKVLESSRRQYHAHGSLYRNGARSVQEFLEGLTNPRLNGAAKHYEAGAHEKAAHHAHIARGHAILAREHAEEAVKAHVEEHGKK
jgi:hypothetical protein